MPYPSAIKAELRCAVTASVSFLVLYLNYDAISRICSQRHPTEIRPEVPQMAVSNPLQFLQQVRGEVAKIHWPARREVLLTTLMVFILAALTATFFSLVDMAIRWGLNMVIGA